MMGSSSIRAKFGKSSRNVSSIGVIFRRYCARVAIGKRVICNDLFEAVLSKIKRIGKLSSLIVWIRKLNIEMVKEKNAHFYSLEKLSTRHSLCSVTSNQTRGGEGETSARVYGIITGETRPLLPRKSLTSHRCKRREHASLVRAIKITREGSTRWR